MESTRMDAVRVHLLGAAGYGAGDMLRYLSRHPHVTFGALESGSAVGTPVGQTFPEVRRYTVGGRLFDARGSVYDAAKAGDIVVLAGSHELAHEAAPRLLENGVRVIDLSDGFRLDWQNRGAIYGFPERYREQIRSAKLLANPGCFPTTALLALTPLAPFAAAMTGLVLDMKSGISGAGRTPKVGSMLTELEGEMRAYGLAGHRHVPEIAQELAAVGITAPFIFTPHVIPIARGMLGSIYVGFSSAPSRADIAAAYANAYANYPAIRILAEHEAPALRAVARTNDAEISFDVVGSTVRILCAIDNLGKGAAGQAVQNLNLMCGFPEELSLDADID